MKEADGECGDGRSKCDGAYEVCARALRRTRGLPFHLGEMTMSHPRGKERLMEGFKIGDTRVHARELTNDELVVSFLNLPFYVEDREILEKLQVSAASPIKRRMWPSTNVADGTRFFKVQAAARRSDETPTETPVPVKPGDWVRVKVKWACYVPFKVIR
ncbi:uncharacterized protein LOC124851640 [Hippoglossus stenolepis]|uniref:uncharacterized protein LOC124851640 n=1 Tax=Hippoglossus stenolepis TaxID=195615 RepID=UPI001FB0047B|nr:uncharacterized protein LOC124851640 [Hippoglossus stenolepis]